MASTFESIDDQKAVPILLRFADSPNSTVRASVMKALRKLNDPRSVPTIVKRLDDPDFFIRYDAVFTLATIEGRQNAEWMNALGEYKTHESKYIAQWKNWWATEGAAKYVTPTGTDKLP
jgi:HEAT repeat protein